MWNLGGKDMKIKGNYKKKGRGLRKGREVR
jgi:hypothetical protein